MYKSSFIKKYWKNVISCENFLRYFSNARFCAYVILNDLEYGCVYAKNLHESWFFSFLSIGQMNKVHCLPVWTAGSKIDESWGYRNIVAAEKAFQCALKINIILVDKIDIDLLSFMRGKQNKIYMLFN